MTVFMGDTPLMKAPTAKTPGSMGELMDYVAGYDNAVNALGYSVYSYAAEMYIAASNVKFIKVDGVAAERGTIERGEYPLLSYNYAVFRADQPQDAPARTLVRWLTVPQVCCFHRRPLCPGKRERHKLLSVFRLPHRRGTDPGRYFYRRLERRGQGHSAFRPGPRRAGGYPYGFGERKQIESF